MPLAPWIRKLVPIALVASLVPLLNVTIIELDRQRVTARRTTPAEGYYLPPPAVLRALSFGYNELGADLLWVRTIAYFADHHTSDHDLRFLMRHLRNIIALDPYSKHVYRYGAAMLMSQGTKRLSNHEVFSAIDLLQQGHRRFPEDWQLPFRIGAYYMYELKTNSSEEKKRWRREGAQWIYRASLLGAEMPWLPGLTANILNEQGERELAIQHLQELYLVTQDEKTRQQIAAKLRHLQADRLASELQNAAKSFKALHQTSPIQFVAEDLFVFVGEAPLPPFSLQRAVSATQKSMEKTPF